MTPGEGTREQPWALAKQAREGNEDAADRLRRVLADLLEACRVISLAAIDTATALTQNMISQPLFESVCGPAELDHPIEALQMVSPPTPGKAEQSTQSAAATVVDFYVDEKGQIRMPVVTESTDETYAQATVSVLNQWHFSSPTRRGKPVAVRVQQKFIFPGD